MIQNNCAQLRHYIIVTLSYWAFMLSDGALRMLVLLYFHDVGYSPISLAFLFLFYEFFGMVTNVFGGYLAHRRGLKVTLVLGLCLQVVAMTALSFLQAEWPVWFAVSFVMLVQAVSGIAKDLTKMSSKTAIKFLVPENKQSALFKWVSIITGSKNAVKGAGFFFGGFLLQSMGFEYALYLMAVLIAIVCVVSFLCLPTEIGRATVKARTGMLKIIFTQGRSINVLATARIFLFAARDIWFVVALPVYLHTVFLWDFTEIGSFMALWVIAYGCAQALCPAILQLRLRRRVPNVPDGPIACELAGLLTVSMLAITAVHILEIGSQYTMIIALYFFGFIFALNSSVHSYLILQYADGDKAAVNVGFYYMANAAGRLLGTLLSGLLYQYAGLEACLVGSAIFLFLCVFISLKLPQRC